MKKYMFRDLDHNDNFLNGKSHHAAGIVVKFNSEIGKPCRSGKDVVVRYFDPFTGNVDAAYRSFDEIELFECEQWEYDDVKKSMDKIEKS